MSNKKAILKVENLTKSYAIRKQESIVAVDNISFKVEKGEILGILGPNGAGKTTTIKMICSLVRPDKGNVLIDGIDNFAYRNKALNKISAVLEGNRNIYWRLTVRENIEFFAALKGSDSRKFNREIDYYINLFDLKDKENEVAKNLSRGMQQKLAIAVAMVSQSEVVILDEPTLGLDVNASYEIRKLLKKLAKEDGRTIILTTHDMNVVQDICERVIIINRGKIIANDKVKNLMKIFEVKAYDFQINGLLKNYQKEQLTQIPHLQIQEEAMETRITLKLNDCHIFYKVIDILKSEDCVINSINSKELNFEKVFMEIVERSVNIEEKNTAM
ncbi:ABC transporter ATP-binding protein [Brassicibacter mesophilus]|uniref:ABC transporter ATP-binding protein n=1 Tax=Brassicibacter mesophilus TaxID=745119 RepID=UPI003D1E64C6